MKQVEQLLPERWVVYPWFILKNIMISQQQEKENCILKVQLVEDF